MNVAFYISGDVEDSATDLNIGKMQLSGAPLIERMDAEAGALGYVFHSEKLIHIS